jgi:hypothetical protein
MRHVDSPAVKLRLPGRRADAGTTTDPSTDLSEQLVRAGSKGRPTPKRSEAQGRRQGPPPPPPTSRKEAYRRMRQTQATTRPAARAAAARGDDSALPARDRGPVRKLVRDTVDSRRNVGSLLLVVAVLLVVAEFTPSLLVKSYVFAAFTGLFLLFVLDSFVLSRKIRRAVAERFPDSTERIGKLVWYGVSRSTMIRKWRFPKADPAITGKRAPAGQ